MFRIITLVFFFFTIISGHAFAVTKSVTVTVSPQTPNAGQTVHIQLQSFSVDLNRAKISWFKNTKLIDSGTGNISLDVIAGAVGEITTIDITVISNEGDIIKRTVTVRPGEIDVLWEATSSYVPPFYEGKALPSSEGTIKFVALPNIKTSSGIYLKPSDFIYSWKHGFTFDQAGSGYAKNVYVVYNTYLNQGETVSVSAASNQNTYSASRELFVPLAQPFILFYESLPLSGVNYAHRLVNNIVMDKTEMTVVAEPYFVGPNILSSSALSFDWKINGITAPTPTDKNKLVVRKAEGQKGVAQISVSVRNVFKLFSEAVSSLSISL